MYKRPQPQRLFQFNTDSVESMQMKPQRKTRKTRKPPTNISRKSLSRVEEDLKKEYRKYVNSIRRKKSCRIKSFRVFANSRMGKKKRRSSKQAKTTSLATNIVSEPTSTEQVAETEPSATAESSATVEPSPEPSVESSTASPEPEPSAESPSPEPEPSASAEQAAEPEKVDDVGIVKSVADALGLSSNKEEPTKTGGKKSKRKNRRRSGKK
jgi:hypothetical protein